MLSTTSNPTKESPSSRPTIPGLSSPSQVNPIRVLALAQSFSPSPTPCPGLRSLRHHILKLLSSLKLSLSQSLSSLILDSMHIKRLHTEFIDVLGKWIIFVEKAGERKDFMPAPVRKRTRIMPQSQLAEKTEKSQFGRISLARKFSPTKSKAKNQRQFCTL
jgi:hypothetical protein